MPFTFGDDVRCFQGIKVDLHALHLQVVTELTHPLLAKIDGNPLGIVCPGSPVQKKCSSGRGPTSRTHGHDNLKTCSLTDDVQEEEERLFGYVIRVKGVQLDGVVEKVSTRKATRAWSSTLHRITARITGEKRKHLFLGTTTTQDPCKGFPEEPFESRNQFATRHVACLLCSVGNSISGISISSSFTIGIDRNLFS